MMDDVDHIMHVMAVAFEPIWGEAWNRRQISDSLMMPHTHARIIDAAGNAPSHLEPAAGFTLIRSAAGEEELLLIAVKPTLRGTGLGKRLLQLFTNDAIERGAERIFLEMRENNPARHLYSNAGFEPIGRRPDYYHGRDGQSIDAITFAKHL